MYVYTTDEKFHPEILSFLTSSSDLLALNKEHLHSCVSQLLAGQMCFREHDCESDSIYLIAYVNSLFELTF